MPATLGWSDIALRLALTVVAGAAIGLNREEGGRAAGLRTTLLVCLAASLAMIEANLLLNTVNATGAGIVRADVMRLALGVLTGVGFIGAGAIVKKGDRAEGVTTAATIWFVTALGLCLGAGFLGLGMAGTALGVLVLWVLKLVERRLRHERTATLTVVVGAAAPSEQEIRDAVLRSGATIASWAVTYAEARLRDVRCALHWRGQPDETGPPAALRPILTLPGVAEVRWET